MTLESKLSTEGKFSATDSKRYSSLSAVVGIYKDYTVAKSNYQELLALAHDQDILLREEAAHELVDALPQLQGKVNKLKEKLLPPHEFADNPCLLELRPGVGGSEAMIFAEDLITMYERYCLLKGWKYEILSKNAPVSGVGVVDAVLSISVPGSYDLFRHEAGVHRVQRVPATETKGRIHTSTAAVVVLPKFEESASTTEKRFKDGELRIDVMRASGSGGQHVNTTESAVRITHIPTGIVVLIQDERSQHKNKAKALEILRSRLAEKERLQREDEENQRRHGQVSTTDRSDKIRTYNYAQNRVTDHRCGLSIHNLEGVMDGSKLDEIINAVRDEETKSRSKKLIEE